MNGQALIDQIACVGLSFRTASIDIREQATLSNDQLADLMGRVRDKQIANIDELVILSTCNRTELIAVGQPEQVDETLIALLAEYTHLPLEVLHKVTYRLHGQDALWHVMRVAAGLESQVIGEAQILGQVVKAQHLAQEQQTIGTLLFGLMRYAIGAGKRVRHETTLAHGLTSIAAAAVEQAITMRGDLRDANVLLVGAGSMARSAAATLRRHNIGRLLVASRSQHHAEQIAREYNGEVWSLTNLSQALYEADIVIAAATVSVPLITETVIKSTMTARPDRPLTMIDLGLPRNVDPAINQLEGVTYLDLDHVDGLSQRYHANRKLAISAAEAILCEEMLAFEQWVALRTAAPAIRALRDAAEAQRTRHLDRLLRRLPDLTERERELITQFSHQLTNQLLHEPTITRRNEAARL